MSAQISSRRLDIDEESGGVRLSAGEQERIAPLSEARSLSIFVHATVSPPRPWQLSVPVQIGMFAFIGHNHEVARKQQLVLFHEKR